MIVDIRRTSINELDRILCIQIEAFMEDLRTYRDFETNPAAESRESLRSRIINSDHMTIIADNVIVGGASVQMITDAHCQINHIFLKLQHQDKGIGSSAMKAIEASYPNVTRWTIRTVYVNEKNKHFFEKLGYKKVSERKISEHIKIHEFEKIVSTKITS